MAFYNKLVLTNIGEYTLNEVLSSGRNLLLSELRLSADVYNQTEVKNLVSLSNTANIIATSSVILEEETDNFIISGSFSNKDITEPLTINSIGLYSILDNTTKLIGVATAIEPIIIKPFRNTVNFYNLKLSLALKPSEYNAIEIINGNHLDMSVLDSYVKKSEMTVEISDLNGQLNEKANLSYVEQAITDIVDTHIVKKDNPHAVTKAQVGLGNVDNVKQATKAEFDLHEGDTTKHISAAERTKWNSKQDNLNAGSNISISSGTISAIDTIYNDSTVQAHMNNKLNPHAVTKTQVGLSNVSNVLQASKSEFDVHTEDTVKHITTSERSNWNSKQNNLGFTPENISNKGMAGGYASLNSAGKIPASELPSYVDDVVEGTALANLPTTGETGKIYVTTNDNKTYRWSGTGYTEISASLALGTTSSTAYRGDLGNIAYNHSQSSGNPHNTTKAQVGLGNVDNTSDINKPVSSAVQLSLDKKADSSQVLTDVPANAKFTDTVYTHPANHPASIITETSTKRFVTDSEKANWNSKTDDTTADTHIANKDNPHAVTKSQVGLGNVANILQASKSEFSDHSEDVIRHTTALEKATWDAKQDTILAGDNVVKTGNTISAVDTVYTHPSNHPASMITESSTKRFVTDTEKANWNTKTDDTTADAHIAKKDNPHAVTKAQVGLGSVDNIKQATKAEFDTHNADTTKHITAAERTAWNAKQENLTAGANVSISEGVISAVDTVYNDTAVQSHISNKTNPHGITKAQVGLGSVTNVVQASKTEFDSHDSDTTKHITASERSNWNNKQNALGFTPENASNKGKASGYASLDSSGRVPASELPSYVDDVVEATTLANLPITGETGKIYVTTGDNKTYRWSGTGYVEISSSLALGTTSSTAYRGDLGNVAYTHSQSNGNPHNTTKAQVGLGNVDNTNDTNKPVSTATQSALDLKADKSQVLTDVPANAKFTDTVYTHPSSHPASMITESTTKRFVSDVEKTAWNNKTDDSTVNTHIAKIDNPHDVTKSQVGLGNVDNVKQASKVEFDAHVGDATHVTTTEKDNWNAKQDTIIAGTNLTKSGNTLNATDTKYNNATTLVSGLMSNTDKSKLDGVATGANNYTHPSSHPATIITETSTKRFVTDTEKSTWNTKTDDTTVDAHIAKKDNPHEVTKAQVGLANVDNIKQATKTEFDAHNGDMTRHITIAERTAWNAKQGNLTAGTNVTITDGAISAIDTVYDDSNVQSHIANKLNPHGVTKAQVGLGNVSNVVQASKAEFDTHNTDTVKHITTTERNTWNAKQNALGFTPENISNKSKANGYASLDANGKVPASELPSYVDDVVEGTTLANLPTTGETGKIYVTTNDNKTYRWSGTGYVEISSSLALGTTSSTAYRGDLGNVAYTHSQSSGNPHNTTKAQVGLGNVDNTSDANKPVSTAMQTELNKKVNNSQVLTDVPANAKFTDTVYAHPSTHPASIITESSTKRFVSDAEKTTWNNKTDDSTVDTHIAKIDNPHNVTKAQVGLGSVDNTSDANKPVSTATQSALNNKADKSQVLTNVPANAKFTDTVYAHPSTHPATMIVEDTGHRFVTDTEKNSWNAKTNDATVNAHIAKKDNPHSVTKAQVGLGSVDNTSDVNKPVSNATQTALDNKADIDYVDEAIENKAYGKYQWVYNEDHDSLDLVVT